MSNKEEKRQKSKLMWRMEVGANLIQRGDLVVPFKISIKKPP
jgi:hypothetical protein